MFAIAGVFDFLVLDVDEERIAFCLGTTGREDQVRVDIVVAKDGLGHVFFLIRGVRGA